MNGSGLIFTCKRLFKIAVAMLIFILATTQYTPAYAKSVLNRLNINFESGFDKEAVQEILSRHYGKEVTVDLLRIVLDEVDHYFHEHGYPTSKAYFPLQQSGNGVLDITVISPYLEEVRFKNRANINIQTRRRLFSEITDMQGKIINNNEMLSSLLRLQDLGSFRIFGRYVSGQSRDDATALLLSLRPMKEKYPFTVFADNYGNEASGRYRAGISGEIVNPAGYADKLFYTFSTSNEKQIDAHALYRFPLNSHPTVAGIGFTAGSYSLAKEYEDLGAKGYMAGCEAYMEEPLQRQENFAVKVKIGGALKYLEDRFEAFEVKFKKRQSSFFCECSGYYRNNFLAITADANLNLGKNIELDDYEIDDDKFTVLTAGSALSFKLDDRSEMLLDVALQKSNAPLEGSLRFSAGGEGRVSAFSVSEASADEGMSGSISYNRRLNEYFKIAPHFDAAHICDKGGSSAFIKGIGMRGSFNGGGFFVKGDLTTAIGAVHGKDRARMLVSFGYSLA